MDYKRRYEVLKDVADHYHSSIDRRYVVGLIVSYIEEISPVDLYSYGDNSLLLGIPTKDLYRTGILDMKREILLRKRMYRGDRVTYFPVVGLQGLYGLIEVGSVLDDSDVEFVESLVSLLSKSMEDLYTRDMSEERIRMFQEINRIWLELSECRRLVDVDVCLRERLRELFDADDVILSINRADFLRDRRVGTRVVRRESDVAWLSDIHDEMYKKRDAVFWTEENSPEGSVHLLGSPFIREHKVVGYCVIVSKDPDRLNSALLTVLSPIIYYASLVLYNVILLEHLKDRVELDDLTKLYNRGYLESKIDKSLRNDTCGSLLLMDIDDFKLVNDRYGHKEGDNVLLQVADIIRDSVREFDIAARWGGEELVVYLPDSGIEAGRVVADRLVRNIRETTDLGVTVSCGVCTWEESADYKDIFVKADKALYVAKTSGKNQYVLGELADTLETGED